MSLRLHETLIKCGGCGENLWDVTIFAYDIINKVNVPREEEPVCKGCQRPRFYALLKGAARIEPLKPTNETMEVKGGTVTRMEEAKYDGIVTPRSQQEPPTVDMDDVQSC